MLKSFSTINKSAISPDENPNYACTKPDKQIRNTHPEYAGETTLNNNHSENFCCGSCGGDK